MITHVNQLAQSPSVGSWKLEIGFSLCKSLVFPYSISFRTIKACESEQNQKINVAPWIFGVECWNFNRMLVFVFALEYNAQKLEQLW